MLVCGDPARAEKIAENFGSRRLLSDQREYRSYAGNYHGMELAVCSHGIGAPGAAIAFEEIIAAGAKRIIRVGTCGSLQPGVKPGHLIIATAAVSNTGYTVQTVPKGYPAVADPSLTAAMKDVTADSGYKYSHGIVLTRDNFYAGVDPPGIASYEMMSRANVLAVEMECAALFVIGSLRGVQTAAILAVDGNVLESAGESMDVYRPRQQSVQAAIEHEIAIALRTLEKMTDDAG